LQIAISERLAAAPCTKERSKKIGVALMKDEVNWTPILVDFQKDLSEIDWSYRLIPIPLRYWSKETWESAIASGAASNMSNAQFNTLSTFFGAIELISHEHDNEVRLLGSLMHLNHAGPMSSYERRATFSKLGELEASNREIESMAIQLKALTLNVLEETPIDVDDFTNGRVAASIRKIIKDSPIKKLYPSCYDESQWDDLLSFLDDLTEKSSSSEKE